MAQAKKLFLVCMILFSACTQDAVFVVDITAPEGLFGQEAELSRLRVILEHEGTQSVLFFPEEGPEFILLPTAFSFATPINLRGVINLEVEALDTEENIIASGSSSATIAPGERTRFEVPIIPPELLDF